MAKVRFSSLNGAFDLIRELGGDPHQVLEQARFTKNYRHLDPQNHYIDHQQAEAILQAAADLTHCDYFGALLGTRQDLTILGLLGHVMQHSPDIESALQELIRHLSLQIPSGAEVRLEIGDGYAAVIFQTAHTSAMQANELAISEINHFLGILCGFGWHALEVHFSHNNRSSMSPYKKLFGAPVKFNRDDNRIVFRSSVLQKNIAHSNPELRRILKTHPDILQTDANTSLTERVEQMIRGALPTGNGSIEQIAERLSIHRRTLHRRLRSEGTSFTKLLDDSRKQMAAERLKNSNISIIQLAHYLGYSDNSAFTRSFKRWYGSTPQEWRKSLSN